MSIAIRTTNYDGDIGSDLFEYNNRFGDSWERYSFIKIRDGEEYEINFSRFQSDDRVFLTIGGPQREIIEEEIGNLGDRLPVEFEGVSRELEEYVEDLTKGELGFITSMIKNNRTI